MLLWNDWQRWTMTCRWCFSFWSAYLFPFFDSSEKNWGILHCRNTMKSDQFKHIPVRIKRETLGPHIMTLVPQPPEFYKGNSLRDPNIYKRSVESFVPLNDIISVLTPYTEIVLLTRWLKTMDIFTSMDGWSWWWMWVNVPVLWILWGLPWFHFFPLKL